MPEWECEVRLSVISKLANRQCAKLSRSAYLQKMMDQLKTKPNPKRWWECIKLLAGKALANKIIDAFIAVTQKMSSLPPVRPR
jgi:hypothetical protein